MTHAGSNGLRQATSRCAKQKHHGLGLSTETDYLWDTRQQLRTTFCTMGFDSVMKNVLNYVIYIGILLAGGGCATDENGLRNGDLIFEAVGNSAAAKAIDAATARKSGESFAHVAIIEVATDGVYVIEAASESGVQRIALAEFLDTATHDEAGNPAVVVMRLKRRYDTATFIANAKRHIGEPYDHCFMPNNGRMYCSELVYESYRDESGKPIFTARPMNFRAADGSMPPYWVELFATLGEAVPQGVLGTNPNDMAHEPILERLPNGVLKR